MPQIPPSARPLPPGMRHYFLEAENGLLHLVAGGRGAPLVMTHGLGGSGEDFYDLASLLADRRTLILPDLWGFGLSAKPDAAYDTPFFTRCLLDLANGLSLPRADWLGHSLGGQVTLNLALERPDLVKSLCLVCPAGGQAGPSLEQRLLALLLLGPDERPRFHGPWLLRAGVRRVFAEPDSPACRRLAEQLTAQWSGPDRPQRERSLARAALSLLKSPMWPRAGGLIPRVLVVTGERDTVVPAAETDRLLRHLPRGATHRRLDLGHMLPYSRPAELALLLREFLEQDAV